MESIIYFNINPTTQYSHEIPIFMYFSKKSLQKIGIIKKEKKKEKKIKAIDKKSNERLKIPKAENIILPTVSKEKKTILPKIETFKNNTPFDIEIEFGDTTPQERSSFVKKLSNAFSKALPSIEYDGVLDIIDIETSTPNLVISDSDFLRKKLNFVYLEKK